MCKYHLDFIPFEVKNHAANLYDADTSTKYLRSKSKQIVK
jgi:hypothetical protein